MVNQPPSRIVSTKKVSKKFVISATSPPFWADSEENENGIPPQNNVESISCFPTISHL